MTNQPPDRLVEVEPRRAHAEREGAAGMDEALAPETMTQAVGPWGLRLDTPPPQPAMSRRYRGFHDGQPVTHRTWTNPAGRPRTGAVRVYELSPQDRAEGCAEAEVCWHGSCVADQLDLVIDDIH
jgi:hypothetical protein